MYTYSRNLLSLKRFYVRLDTKYGNIEMFFAANFSTSTECDFNVTSAPTPSTFRQQQKTYLFCLLPWLR